MITYTCDNCGTDLKAHKTRHIWYKEQWDMVSMHYEVDLCDKCWYRLLKHIKKVCERYGGSKR